MTPFRAYLIASGLSQTEAAAFIDCRIDTVKSWSSGRNNCPDRVLEELANLVEAQERMVNGFCELVDQHPEAELVLGYCADDIEAQARGMPFKSAHDMVIARCLAIVGHEHIVLKPVGSTVELAEAERQIL